MIREELIKTWTNLKDKFNQLSLWTKTFPNHQPQRVREEMNILRQQVGYWKEKYQERNTKLEKEWYWWNRWNSELNNQNLKFLDISAGQIYLYGGGGESKSWPIESICSPKTKRQMKLFFNQHIYTYYRDK